VQVVGVERLHGAERSHGHECRGLDVAVGRQEMSRARPSGTPGEAERKGRA
jgi:hypothetical protein